MDGFTEICYKLEECSKHKLCCGDRIVCTKKFLNAYIGEEHNRFLKLKAELKNSYEAESAILPNWSVVLSSCVLCLSIAGNVYDGERVYYDIIGLLVLWVILFMKIGVLKRSKDFKVCKKWRKYIEVVLEDMEKFQ